MNQKSDKEETVKATFLLGLPDSRFVKVGGYNGDGQMVFSWAGNSDFHNYIKIPNLAKNYISIIWFSEPPRTVKKPNIVINCINDADTCGNSLKKAIEITGLIQKQWPDVPVFNNPNNIARTTRDAIYQQFKGLAGLYLPKVVRINPESKNHVLELAATNGIKFPFLIRKCGTHQSSGLQVIRSEADIDRLEKYAYDGGEYYLTEFVNNKDSDGFYRKARLVIIDGKMYARHYMTSEQWMVYAHIHYNYMANNEAAKKTEEHFVNNFESIINPQALESLYKINDSLGLDYLGFDVSIMPDGKLLIFEINVAQNALLSVDFTKFPYMEKVKDRIVGALNKCILDKSNSAKSLQKTG